jgi:hypothetical protein
MRTGALILQKLVKMTISQGKAFFLACQMMWFPLPTCSRGCIKCFHGDVQNATYAERNDEIYDTCEKSATLAIMIM